MPRERLARSGSYSLIGSSFAALAALALTVLVGNGLGAYGTGLFFQAVGIFTVVSQVLRLGTNSSIVKMISEQRAFGRAGETWRSVIIGTIPVILVSIVVAVFIVLFSGPLSRWLGSAGEQQDLAQLLRDMAPFVVLAAVLAVLQTATRMLRGVGTFTILQSVLLPLSRLILVAIAVSLAWSALDVFRGWMAAIPLWLVVTLVVLARPLLVDWRQRRSAREPTALAARKFWAFSGTRAVGGAFETALEWSDVLIVAALGSPAAAGVYAVATRTVRAGQVVDRAMRLAVSPTISEMLARSELVAARNLHTAVTRAMVLSNWPYYLILATMGPAVLRVFGAEFEDGAVVLAILAGAMMISSGAGMLQSILLQGGKSSWQMANKGLTLAISIGLNLVLVPVLGILGAALTWTTGILVETAIASWQVHRRMGVLLQPRKLLLAMAIPLLVFGVGGVILRIAFGHTLLVLVLGLFVLGTVYLLLMWVLRARLGIVSLWAEVPIIGTRLRRSPSAVHNRHE